MTEDQLPVHDPSAEDTKRVRPAVDSGNGGVHIPPERVTHVEPRPAGNYLADDLSNSVQITLAKRVIKPGSAKAICLAEQASIPICDDESSSVSNPDLKLADGTRVALSLSFFNGEAAQNVTPMPPVEPPTHSSAAGSASAALAVAVAPREPRDSKLETWLLPLAVISVTALYTICNPKWVPSFVPQTAKISKQLSADIKTASTPPAAPASLKDVAHTAVQHHGTSSGAHRTVASDRNETGTRDFMNQGFNQGFTFPITEIPKAAEAKTSKSKKGLMVPPPPPTPCVLPPAFGFSPLQPAQPSAAAQQQLLQAQAQDSPKTDNQAAAREKTPQQSDQELQAADQELQAALRSSLLTEGKWKR